MLATAVVVVLPRSGLPGAGLAADIALTFVSLVLEAAPFLMAGSLLSVAFSSRVGGLLQRSARRRPRLTAALAPLSGLGLPLCDCGLVPIARQLHADGTPAPVVNAFVAGAPLTNPVVIASTVVAFPGQPGMVAGRLLIGLALASIVASLVTRPQLVPAVADHDCADAACSRPSAVDRVGAELRRTGPLLVVGALVAATFKEALPLSWLVALSEQPLLGAAALMLLAFVLSLCSQADAFVAAALPVGPLPRLAFLVMGPVLDIKLVTLYRQSFGTRWVLSLAAVVVPSVLILCTLWVAWSPL